MNLKQLFNPKSIAIIGATEKEGKVGRVVAENVLNMGFSGQVFLVNPNYETLFGQKCYKSLEELEIIRLTKMLIHFMPRIKATFWETPISGLQNLIY